LLTGINLYWNSLVGRGILGIPVGMVSWDSGRFV